MGQYDPARAKALLDIYGYVDRDGDGWREQPDGSPLLIRRASQPDQFYRSLDELWQRNMQAIGIRGVIEPAKWPENLKAAQAGSLMSWFVNSSASQFDGQSGLGMMFSPKIGGDNMARFKSAEFDALYLKMQALPDGPERWALFRQAQRIGIVYAPYKCHVHRYVTDVAAAEVQGYRRPRSGTSGGSTWTSAPRRPGPEARGLSAAPRPPPGPPAWRRPPGPPRGRRAASAAWGCCGCRNGPRAAGSRRC
jgi:ABC-type transport system substrate-binding protein